MHNSAIKPGMRVVYIGNVLAHQGQEFSVLSVSSVGTCLVLDDTGTQHTFMNSVLVPVAVDQQEAKRDAGKVQMHLLLDDMPNAILEVAKVLTWAVEVKGYKPGSWRDVSPFNPRYNAALYRHLNALARGEQLDEESGLPHRAHAACCILFQLQKELE